MQMEFAGRPEGVRSVLPSTQTHATWKTVWSGEGRGLDEIRYHFTSLGVEMSPAAARVIEQVCQGQIPQLVRIRLVLKTVAELDLKKGATFSEIEAALPALGLALCPPDTALVMRHEYASLPDSESVIVMSRPARIADVPCVFMISRHQREIRLDAVIVNPDAPLKSYDRLIFAKADQLEPLRAD